MKQNAIRCCCINIFQNFLKYIDNSCMNNNNYGWGNAGANIGNNRANCNEDNQHHRSEEAKRKKKARKIVEEWSCSMFLGCKACYTLFANNDGKGTNGQNPCEMRIVCREWFVRFVSISRNAFAGVGGFLTNSKNLFHRIFRSYAYLQKLGSMTNSV